VETLTEQITQETEIIAEKTTNVESTASAKAKHGDGEGENLKAKIDITKIF
jgi:hypothetical protein